MAELVDLCQDLIGRRGGLQTGSLIVSFFGDAVLPRGGAIWLGSLIRLLEPLGFNDRQIRTAVFRLVKEGWLKTETLGRRSNYLLTGAGRHRFEEAALHIYASHAPEWDRRWRMVVIVGDMAAKDRDQVRRALFWQGFGVIGGNCFIHPSAHLTKVFDALAADGLKEQLKRMMPMMAADIRSGLAATTDDLVAEGWNLRELASEYERFGETYRPLLAETRADAEDPAFDESAFLLRILLIHDYRRLLLRDPELPDVLLPPDWPGQRARLLCKDIYRRLQEPSERHIDRHMRLADETTPPAGPLLFQRFPDEDPLQR